MIINWNAILALLISIGGLASHPEVMNLLPEKVAVVLTLIGAITQALTQQAVRVPASRADD